MNQTILHTFKGEICKLNKPNENNRVYTKEVWERVLSEFSFYVKLAERKLYLYDDSIEENPEKIAGVITKIEIKRGKVWATIDLIDTEGGQRINSYLGGYKVNGLKVPNHLRTNGTGDIIEHASTGGPDAEFTFMVNPETYNFTGLNWQQDLEAHESEIAYASLSTNFTNIAQSEADRQARILNYTITIPAEPVVNFLEVEQRVMAEIARRSSV